jgi:hypothetical protein
MKLRIKGNSVRLRLTQSEVEQLAAEGSVRESVSFGDRSLGYEIRSVKDASGVSADLNGLSIVISVPEQVINDWAGSDSISIEYEGTPSVLIEKDFACLSERKNEDDADAFPNPRGKC